MKIIIVGSGKVGYAIARQLAQEKHDITMVDNEIAHLSRADSTLDVMCIHGSGASVSVLMDAGARTADLVIAVTGADDTNMVCCLLAKSLGARHTVARVRNTEYRRDAEILKREIGLDMLINPDLAAAQEIARILSFPAAISVEPFAGGRIDMIGLQALPEDSIVGRSLSESHGDRKADVLICAAQRGDECIIPNGSFVPQADDRLYMVGAKSELQKMLKAMGRPLHRVKTVALLGGSRISMYLSWELARTNTHVRIVEQDHEKCLLLSQHLPEAMIIEGDGTDNDLIQAENIFGADGFVSLTGRDEENLLMAMSARRAGVRKVLAKMTRPNYMELVQDTGLGSIISPKDIIANQITRYVRALANSQGMAVESLYKLLGGQVEALEFLATGPSDRLLHVPLKDLTLRSGVLLAAIVRGGATIIPGGLTTIEEGDRVLVIARSMGLKDLADILACPLIRTCKTSRASRRGCFFAPGGPISFAVERNGAAGGKYAEVLKPPVSSSPFAAASKSDPCPEARNVPSRRLFMSTHIQLQRLPQRRVQCRRVRFLAGEKRKGTHRLPDQQVDAAHRPQAQPRRRLQQRRPPRVVHQIVHHRVPRRRPQKRQVAECRAARHPQRGGVDHQPALRRVPRQFIQSAGHGAVGVPRRQRLRPADAAVTHGDAGRTRLRQRMTHRRGRAPRAQQQHLLPAGVGSVPGQTVQKSGAVRVVADGPSLPETHGVHRAAGRRTAVHLVQQRHDGLLQGHGHVAPGAPAVLRPAHKVRQLTGPHRPHIVAVCRPGLLYHGPVDQRRQTVGHRVADDIQLPHTQAAPPQPAWGAASRPRSGAFSFR